MLRCKTAERTILTCDASGFAGCEPGTYQEGDVMVDVLEDGRVVVAGQQQFLAGSGATTGDCIVHMSHACNIPLATSIRMATVNPGKLMNHEFPQRDVGQTATLSIFHTSAEATPLISRFLPVKTIVKGRVLSEAPVEPKLV
jgi:N-acetylglucosamine-6-phosphate deacetylase